MKRKTKMMKKNFLSKLRVLRMKVNSSKKKFYLQDKDFKVKTKINSMEFLPLKIVILK
jgi:hypothetical protein